MYILYSRKQVVQKQIFEDDEKIHGGLSGT